MKDFRNSGWKYLDQFDAIFPNGGASGSRAFIPGTSSTLVPLNPTEDAKEDSCDDFTIPLATLAALPDAANHQLIGHAISTTTTAINSLSMPTMPPGPLMQTTTAPLSGNRASKHQFESVSVNDAPQSASGLGVPVSSSTHRSKRSWNSSNQAVTGSSMDSTSIVLHVVDSSIQHLNNSIESKWVDPLKALEIAASTAQELGVTGLIRSEERRVGKECA